MKSQCASGLIYDAFAAHYREYSDAKSKYIAAVDSLITTNFAGKARSVFDFGCGDGVRGASVFRSLKAEILVCGDVSSEMIKRTRQLQIAEEVWDLSLDDWCRSSRRFDLAICLWNVLGHIRTTEERVTALKRIAGLLSPGGRLCFDVNNRHYRGYGRARVKFRRMLDWVAPDYSRGDVSFEWKIGDKTYPAHGHLFTKFEVMDLLDKAGLRPTYWKSVDYISGAIGSGPSDGQHFFIAERKPQFSIDERPK